MKRLMPVLLVFAFAGIAAATDTPSKDEAQNLQPAMMQVSTSTPAATAPSEPLQVSTPTQVAPIQAEPSQVSTVTAATPIQAEPAKVAKPSQPAMASGIGCVAPLNDLVTYHENEIASLKKMIEEWNGTIGGALKRRQEQEQSLKATNDKIIELQKVKSKANKKEISALKKEASRISKEMKAIDKELRKDCRKLADEVKKSSDESGATFKADCSNAIEEIQK